MDFRRDGSFRQRARNAEITTWQLQEHRKKRVAERTHEAIHQFEENLRSHQENAGLDDLPIEAEAGHPQLHHARRDRHRDNASDASSAKNLTFLRQTSLAEATARATAALDVDTRYARRPPSPCGLYDYGSISTRPRSVLAQRSKKTGDSVRPKHRHSTTGFYFPGAEFRQGGYGFSMLDPIHIAPQAWLSAKEPPVCWEGGPSDLRPQSVSQSHRPARLGTRLVADGVRGSRAHAKRGEMVHRTLDRADEESHVEQVCFEHAKYEGSSGPRMLRERPAAMLESAAALQLDFLAQDPADMEEHQRCAAAILFGLEALCRQRRSKLAHLFRAVTRGTSAMLEPIEFLEGLVRLGLAPEGELSVPDVIEAMLTIDPQFDGRVKFAMLDRAIAAARNVQRQRSEELALMTQQHQAKISTSYSQSLPVDVVKVDHQARSLFDFERAFERFRRQQRELLQHHGEV